MKKKLFLLPLALLMVLVLCSCIEGPPQSTGTQPPATTQPATAPTEPTTQPTQPTSEPTQPTEPPEPEPPLPVLGRIDIFTAQALTGEYLQAQVCVQWGDEFIPMQEVQIRHRGVTSMTAPKKSYNIKLEEKVSLFGMDSGKKWSLLGNHFDKSLLRPSIGFDYAAMLNLPYASQTRLCQLYLDGVYMGIYTAIEPVDAKKGRVEIDPDQGAFIIERNAFREEEGVLYITTNGGLRFEMSDPDEMPQEQLDAALATLNAIEKMIQTKEHTQYSQVIDVASFVDFYIYHELFKDIDFGRFSTRYFVSDGVLYAGPPWDLDFSMGNISGQYWETVYKRYHNLDGQGNGSGDSAQALWVNNKDFYRWLCQDEWFMDQVRSRWQQLRPVTENLYQDNALGTNRIDLFLECYGPALESNYAADGAGWSVSEPFTPQEYHAPADTLLGNVELLRSWLQRRAQWLDTVLLPE